MNTGIELTTLRKKTPGGFPFFQWMERSECSPDLAKFLCKGNGKQIDLDFYNPKNPIFFGIGW